MARNLALFHLPASGSTWLQSMLASTDKVRFCQYVNHGRKGDFRDAEPRMRKAFFEEERKVVDGREQVIAFKTFPENLGPSDALVEFLAETDTSILFIDRANMVKAVISNLRSLMLKEKSGIRFVKKGSDVGGLPPVKIPVRRFVKRLESREGQLKKLTDFLALAKTKGIPVMEVYYEDLQENPQLGVIQALEFLGLRAIPKDIETDLWLKHTSDDLSEMVPNVDELKEAVKKTTYASMFGKG